MKKMHSQSDGQCKKRSFDDMITSSPSSANADHSLPFNPRSYQLKVFEVARKRNTIAVLETGSGKTIIAVMLIKHMAHSISPSPKKFFVFLAPTVHLVDQQYEVIKLYTKLEVGSYYGAKGVDEWTFNCWEKEIKEHDVMVMTPQIFLDALRKAFISLEMVCLLVLDECHRTTGNHPYAKIMKEFYCRSNNKPKIFGMTASPVIRKGVSSSMDCNNQMSDLESILDSQIYTIEDKREMDKYVHSARQTCKFYDKAQVLPNMNLKAKLESVWSKFHASLSELQGSQQSLYKDMEDKAKAVRKRLSNDHAKILCCLDDLGIICAYEAVKVCLENAPNANEECGFYRESSLQYLYYLNEVLLILQEFLPLGEGVLDAGFDYLKAADLGYVSPKLLELLQLFQSFGGAGPVLCLVFVEKIITAKVIERFVKEVTYLSHLSVSYLTGSNSSADGLTPKMQKETLESFHAGKVNLLFATDVVEEGIHVPNCSCVIRFDLPKTVRSYVQSRGRARQTNSQFVTMLERGNTKQLDQLFNIIKSERSMTDTAIFRDPDACILKECTFEETNIYIVGSTGASVTPDSSVSLINRYCDKLPGDKYYTPKPIFYELSSVSGSYQYKLTLPPNAAFQTIVGPLCRNSHMSKQLVCMEACKKLHQMGALDDHLLPFVEAPDENDITVKSKETTQGAGTTKRKELHRMTSIRALSGTWGDKMEGTVFHAYKFEFVCNIVDEFFSGFLLLIESKLDDDVGNIEMELYLVSKFVKSTITPCGQVHLDAEQMLKAKCFQEFVFNGVFGKLFNGSKSSGEPREFLLNTDMQSFWSQSNLFLLLPLEMSNSSNHESWVINWRGINSCASVVEFLKENSLLGNNVDGERANRSPCITSSAEMVCESSNMIHLANNNLVDLSSLTDMVVVAIHTGKIYSIVEVTSDKSAESLFYGAGDAKASTQTTFAGYFIEKYGIALKYPEQPLLRLKQSHNAHNLLVKFTEDEGAPNKPQMHVHLPPELLVRIDLPIHVLKSLYLLPSLVHRLETLMLASQLRGEINCSLSNFQISSSLILEALTTLRCCESFSMERLELLGDSVLKYAVSSHLFLKYPKKHEGQLSARRSWAVCNSTLYKLGIDRKLQGYILDSAFEPRRWVAPGQRSVHPVPCKCGIDTLEVPLDSRFHTEDPKVMVGKFCDKGHRWMGSKTIADCVEALIGAYYISGGLLAALYFMKWLGIDADLDPALVIEAINTASLRYYVPIPNEIATVESKLGYEFSTKGLLQEAITHPSEQELGVGYCYQRLEFLGDSVLDLLITWHLYQNHTDVDPGELTDLRSASVNNESFAQAAVKQNLHQHLQHSSGLLLSQITEYVKFCAESDNNSTPLQITKGPKALGDMVESIAGAILLDTNLNLEEVWRIFEPILSPIVTPDKLELPPLRELNELCDSLGYFIKEECKSKGEMVHAELKLQLKDVLLVGQGYERNRKTAKGTAARHLLKALEKRGISYDRFASKRRKQDGSFAPELGSNGCKTDDQDDTHLITGKKPMPTWHAESSGASSPGDALFKKGGSTPNSATPIIEHIPMKKGGPRTCLFELCKKLQWPAPTFTSTEQKSRTPIEFGEGSERRQGFSSFESRISLYVPNFGNIECTGDPRADKKTSFDSAAVVMLHLLEQQGKLIIGDS